MPRHFGETSLDAGGPLSADQAVEMARQIAGIAAAGLPLPSGLEALGRELPRGAMRSMLTRIARRVEKGEPLESALDAEGSRFPAPLRGLITAGVRSGRLAESLGRFLDLYELGHTLRRQMAVSLIYPAILLVTAFLMFVGASLVTANGFGSVFSDFGIDIPWITRQMLVASQAVASAGTWILLGPLVGLFVMWLTMRLTLSAAERNQAIHWVPLLGPLAKYTALAQFCPVLALLIESDVPLPEAMRLAGDSARDAGMRTTAHRMASDVERGKSLGGAVADRPPFPRGFGKFLSWAETNRGLVEALRISTETFEARARAQAAFVGKFCNVMAMVVVIWWVGLTVLALFLPMVRLLNVLGGSGSVSVSPELSIIVGTLLVTALALVGIVAIVFIVRWTLRARVAKAALAESENDAPRPRFFYYASMGWALVGISVGALLLMWLMNEMGRGEWIPEWWLTEVWPYTQVMGITIAILGVLMIVFSHFTRRGERRAVMAVKQPRARKLRIRFPTWRFGLRHMMFAMAPLALGFVLARDFGWSILTVMGMLSPPILIVSAFVILSDRRSLQRDGLLQIMAMAARRDQPLAPAILAFSETCRGGYRRKVERFGRLLESGDSLPAALRMVPKILSETGAIAAHVGWQTGTLGRMLEDAVASSSSEKAAKVAAVGSVGYPLTVMAAIAGAGTFQIVFLGESLSAIFKDFGVDLPEPSRTIFRFFRSWAPHARDPYLASFLSLGVMVLLAVIGWVLWHGGRWFGRVMPLGDRLMRRRHSAVILRTIAAGIETGQTLPSILVRLGEGYPRPWARSRLKWSAERVNRGDAWAETLMRAGLIGSAECALIRSAERAGNLPWALRETANGGERRLVYRLQALGQVLQPLAIVALGAVVLLFAVTYFRPLITLIETLSVVEP